MLWVKFTLWPNAFHILASYPSSLTSFVYLVSCLSWIPTDMNLVKSQLKILNFWYLKFVCGIIFFTTSFDLVRAQTHAKDESISILLIIIPSFQREDKANPSHSQENKYRNWLFPDNITSRSKRPITPSTRPAAPTEPMDSPNNKAASTATVRGCESIITWNHDNILLN